MTSRHTPGPYSVGETDFAGGQAITIEPGIAIVLGHGMTPASNAKLLAAAPMLIEVIEQWPELDDPDMDLNGADLLDWFAQWRERVKDALQ